jgi:hypothetical protein
VGRTPRGGTVVPSGGVRVVCTKDIFIKNEIWAQYYIIYIYISRYLLS